MTSTTKFEDCRIEFKICEQDFINFFGRKPKSKKEFEHFCHYSRSGLESQIDWNMIFHCAKEAMECGY